MKLDEPACRALLAAQPVARLATIGPQGPHLVPMVFAVDGDTILSAVDGKPKSTTQLQRLRNLAANPRATILVDHYEDDWSKLWWVRADAIGRVSSQPGDVAAAVAKLSQKYPHYRESPPLGPVVSLAVSRWTGWAASATAPPQAPPRQ